MGDIVKLTQLLDRPIAYHRCFVTLTGSVKAAILLSQAMYWQQRAKQKDGWWYKTADEWEEETGLTRHEQQTARKDCEPFLMSDLRGVPATLFWKVNEDAISQALFVENSETSLTESAKLDLPNQSNINKNTETTTQTTTDIKNTGAKTAPLEISSMPLDWQVAKSDNPVMLPTQEQAWKGDVDLVCMSIGKYGADLEPLARAFMDARRILPAGKSALGGWGKALREMKRNHVTPDNIKMAVQKMAVAKMTVVDPWGIMKTAISIANPIPEEGKSVQVHNGGFYA